MNEKMKFSSLEEMERWVSKYDTKDEAMFKAGYASGRKQYKRFKDAFENKAKKKPSKRSRKSNIISVNIPIKRRTEVLQLNWKEVEAYIIQKKVDQQMKFGAMEPELKRFIDNVLENKKQYRVVKDYHNYINGYLREKGIEIVI